MTAVRRMSPALAWGSLGAASAVLMVVVLAQWLAAGVHGVDPGPDELPTGKLVLLRVLEWGQFAALAILLWRYVARPLRRGEPLGFDALLIIGALALNFWDPLDNYLNFTFQYNAHHLNVNSWGGYLPGWRSPGAETWAVPVAFVSGAYVWAFLGATQLGCAILDRTAERWGLARGYALVFAANAGITAVAELIYLQTDAIANVGTPDALTLWDGRASGWPLYNPILFGAAWTALVVLRRSCLRDPDGRSFVERGAERLPFPTLARLLAVSAYLQVTYIALYFVPWNLIGLAHDAPPPLRSYFPVP